MTTPGLSSSGTAVTRLLDQRARALARPVEEERPGLRDMLVVLVAGDRMALDLAAVRQVVSPGPITVVPGTPGLLGLRNVGGELVAVADLAGLVGATPTVGPAEAAERWLVVLDAPPEPLGVLVDEAEGVARLAPEPATTPSGDRIADHPLMVGLAEGVLVLDAHALVTDARVGADLPEPPTNEETQ